MDSSDGAAHNSERSAAKPRGKPRGRPFSKGQSGNPGGRSRRTRKSYEQVTMSVVTKERWQTIVEAAVLDAEKGDAVARAFVAKAIGAEGAAKIEQKVDARVQAPHTDDVSKILADPAATIRLLDAVQNEPEGQSNGTNGVAH